MKAGTLDSLLRIEQPQADDALDGAGSGEWVTLVAMVWAQVQDMLPSRSERIDNGFNVSARPSRVRMHYRADVTSDMRFVDITNGDDGRIMQIVSGPAIIGRRDGLEFMVEDYSPAGNTA
jgi:head-tail adaptor